MSYVNIQIWNVHEYGLCAGLGFLSVFCVT